MMSNDNATHVHEMRSIEGEDALVSTGPGELYIDLPMSTPRYIRVREGDSIREGDIRTQTSQDMDSLTLSTWRIESITTDTVTGTDIETGETHEWDRDWLTLHLGTGEFSAELTEFGRVSVSETTGWGKPPVGELGEGSPRVTVVVYANTGQQFTQVYAATEPGERDSLVLVQQDPHVDEFSEKVRDQFDEAVTRALRMERRYTTKFGSVEILDR